MDSNLKITESQATPHGGNCRHFTIHSNSYIKSHNIGSSASTPPITIDPVLCVNISFIHACYNISYAAHYLYERKGRVSLLLTVSSSELVPLVVLFGDDPPRRLAPFFLYPVQSQHCVHQPYTITQGLIIQLYMKYSVKISGWS